VGSVFHVTDAQKVENTKLILQHEECILFIECAEIYVKKIFTTVHFRLPFNQNVNHGWHSLMVPFLLISFYLTSPCSGMREQNSELVHSWIAHRMIWYTQFKFQ